MTLISWKEELAKSFAKQGPWAIVAAGLLVFFGFELHLFLRSAGASVSDYVSQSSVNIQVMREAVVSLTVVAKATQDNVRTNGILIGQTVELMEGAKQMMSDIPAERKQQTVLLEDQSVVLKEIRDAVRKN